MKYSYCLVGDPTAVAGVSASKDLVLSGLWQWSFAFSNFGKRGDVRLLKDKEDIEKYDCIHINMTGGNLALPQMYRSILGNSSSTKLIINVDFDIMDWGLNWPYPTILEKQLQYADILFHVEPYGASALEHALGRVVHAWPHPVDTRGLYEHRKIDRKPYITTIYHRYQPDITTPYWATRNLPLKSVLLGYSKGKVPSLSLYDQTFEHIPFLDAIEIMSESFIGLDTFHGYNYGRTVAEFAALAIPCICSCTIDASHRLFPELTVHPFDLKRIHELGMTLCTDPELYEQTFTQAFYNAKYYSQETSYNRMSAALEMGE